jgi:stage II sporulation protein D
MKAALLYWLTMLFASQVVSEPLFPLHLRVLLKRRSSKILIEGCLGEKSFRGEVAGEARGALVQGQKVSLPMTILPSRGSGVISLTGKKYRGRIEIHQDPQAKGRLMVINELPLEDYLLGLDEVPPSWEPEALKAAAIAARTYALWRLLEARKQNRKWDICATSSCQVYSGVKGESPQEALAVEETKGLILVDSSGRVVPAFYSSSTGGSSADIRHIFPGINPEIYRVGMDTFSLSNSHGWERQIGKKELAQALREKGFSIGEIRVVSVSSRSDCYRAIRVRIEHDQGALDLSAQVFRRIIQGKSALFFIADSGPDLVILGLGWGHGVGLSQWGAQRAARAGVRAFEILEYYFPGATLSKLF